MAALLFLLLTVGWGTFAAARLLPEAPRAVRLAGGAVAGIFITAFGTAALSLLLPSAWVLGSATAASAAACAAGAARCGLSRPGRPFLLSLAAVLAAAVILTGTHSLVSDGSGGFRVPGYAWADLALHLSLASSFAERPMLSLAHLSLYPQAPLTYPFLIDWYSSLLYRLTPNWWAAVALPGGVLLASAGTLSSALIRRLYPLVPAGLHVFLFAAAGSAGGVAAALDAAGRQGFGALLETDWSNLPADGFAFANPVTSMFLPQRSFLLGFAAAMLIGLLLERAWRKQTGPYAAAVLIGLLPFAHAHALPVCACWLAALAAAATYRRREDAAAWTSAVLVAALVAVPQIAWQLRAVGPGFGRWSLGWMLPTGMSPLLFGVLCLGPGLPALLAAPWVLRAWRPGAPGLAVGAVGLGTVAAGLVRVFQPSPFDNLKLMLYGWWVVAAVLAWALMKLARTGWGLPMAALIAASVTGSGVLAVIRDLRPSSSYPFLSAGDVRFAAAVRAATPPDAVVLTTDRHNHPVPVLAGRQVVHGYWGWLWSYGLDTGATRAGVAAALASCLGDPAAARRLGAGYAALSDGELAERGCAAPGLEQLAAEGGWHLYRL